MRSLATKRQRRIQHSKVMVRVVAFNWLLTVRLRLCEILLAVKLDALVRAKYQSAVIVSDFVKTSTAYYYISIQFASDLTLAA